MAFPGEDKAPIERTYKDSVYKWNRGAPAIKARFLEQGRTSTGHWSDYSKLVPLKKA